MPQTRRALRAAVEEASFQGDVKRNLTEIEREVAKINELLMQSGLVYYCGFFRDFVSQFDKTPVEAFLRLNRGHLAELGFIRQFSGLLLDLCTAISKRCLKVSLCDEQQAHVWMCCVLYLTIIATEEYTTDVDTKFPRYFGEYLVARLSRPEQCTLERGNDAIKLACKAFNDCCANLISNNVLPKVVTL
jgi:hypothetical protein